MSLHKAEPDVPVKFRKLAELGTEGILILTPGWLVAYASPSVEALLGYLPEELLGLHVLTLSHPDEHPMLVSLFSDIALRPGVRIPVPVYRIQKKDGACRWIESLVTNMLEDPDIGGLVYHFHDVTKDRISQIQLLYANKLYDFLRHINQAIVHATDETVLFEEACRIAVAHGDFRYAWVGIPDPENGTVRKVAQAGETARDEEFFSDYRYDPNGPIAQILEGADCFVVDHIQSRQNHSFITYANDRGFQSALVLPVRKSGKVFAVLSLYAVEKSFFNHREVALLSEAAADLSFAVDVLERDQQRSSALRKLQQKELRLNHAQKIANLGSWEHDLATGRTIWSEQALRIYGLDTRDENPAYEQWISCIHPEDRIRVYETSKKAEQDLRDCSLYYRILLPSGSSRYVHSHSYFEFDEKGTATGLIGILHDLSEIRQQKQALRASHDAFQKSESRYRQIVENAHEGIWLLDSNNRTVFANGRMCEILGTTPRDLHGMEYSSFIASGEMDIDAGCKEPYSTLLWLRGRNDKLIWANVAFGPVSETGRLALVSDATEKKVLEELLESATNMARIGGYEVDIPNDSMFWSPMTRDIHEVDDSFIPHLESAIGFYKEGASRTALTEAGYKALKDGIAWDLELEITTAKGRDRWVRVIGRTEHRDGRCTRIYGSFQDIDTRKRAELQVLAIAEEKNRILESIGNAFFAVDTLWNVTYWNKESERLLGYKRGEVIGRNLWELYPETIGTDYFRYYHRAVSDNLAQHFEAVYEPLHMWTEVSAYPSQSGLSVYFKDITERKKAESERTAMMAEIIRRNQDLEQFSYIVSHNLRGPVANIMGIAAELENGHPSETETFLRESLLVSGRRLDEVICDLNGILQLKKEVTENRTSICLHWLVDGIRESIIDVVSKENVTITTDFTAVGELVSLKSYLYSIFYNLIINSIKYRQATLAPCIAISSGHREDKVEITFRDNGMGIDLGTRGEQVFGLYKRFHDHVEGKGLGLFMVKTQVEMLGGTIELESEVGAGTTIKLLL